MKHTINPPVNAAAHYLSLTGHREKWISGLNGALGIAVTLWISQLGSVPSCDPDRSVNGRQYGVAFRRIPHSAFSAPWAGLGGHVALALIGIACAWLLVPNAFISTLLLQNPGLKAGDYIAAQVVVLQF